MKNLYINNSFELKGTISQIQDYLRSNYNMHELPTKLGGVIFEHNHFYVM